MSSSQLVVVGGGRMGEALAAGLLSSGWAEDNATSVTVVESASDRRTYLVERHPGIRVVETVGAIGAETVDGVLAVKPNDMEAASRELAAAGAARVLSIAAGVTLGALEAWLPDAAVIRAMPNTPSLVGAGAAAISAGHRAQVPDVEWAREILEAVGMVVELPEKALDAVTGLSGSGPAYVFLLAEALIDAGVLVGLARSVAKELAVATLLGSARLLAETGDEPSELRAAVTSPGGTTAAGLRALEAAGFRSAVLDAVSASADRARQMGQ